MQKWSYTNQRHNHEYATSHTPRFAELVYHDQEYWRPFQGTNFCYPAENQKQKKIVVHPVKIHNCKYKKLSTKVLTPTLRGICFSDNNTLTCNVWVAKQVWGDLAKIHILQEICVLFTAMVQ